jgi:hypothetical protein
MSKLSVGEQMKLEMLLPLFMLLVVFAGCIGGQPETPPVNDLNDSQDEEVEVPVEEVVEETPVVEIVDYSQEINSGESVYLKWEITGADGTVSKTAVYAGKLSSDVGVSTSPGDTNYDLETQEYASGQFIVPGEFTDYLTIDSPGTYYARAHTVVAGDNVWSDEVIFTVNGAGGQAVKEFTVEVDDSGFEPNEISVNKGDLVIIHFNVADTVHENGVRIISPGWGEAPALMPGDTQTVQFTADLPFEYRLFWLAGNLLRAKAAVSVE